jgi:hypothetical protein
MKIIAYTARFGDTDALRPPVTLDERVRYLCFSDTPCDVAPYEWIRMPSASDPRMAARRLKVLADHPLLTTARITVWHDASYRLLNSPRWMVQQAPADADLFAMHHPRRFTIEQEAVAIARYGYLPIDTAATYVAGYRKDGFAADVLTASGLLGRRLSPRVTAFNEYWWAEVQRWHGRDQSSTDYAAWKAGATVYHLPGSIKVNPYASWRVRPTEAVPA